MYPGYYKGTQEAAEVFRCIAKYGRRGTLGRISVRVDRVQRFLPKELSSEWSFEALSPHTEDMTSSNNSSLFFEWNRSVMPILGSATSLRAIRSGAVALDSTLLPTSP